MDKGNAMKRGLGRLMSKGVVAASVCGALLTGMFSGAAAANTQVEYSLGEFNTSLRDRPQDVVTSSETDVGFEVLVAHEVLDGLSLTVGYLDQGKGRAVLSTDTLTPAAYHESVSSVTPILASGFTAGIQAAVVDHARWQLLGEAGVFAWEAEITSEATGQSRIRTDIDGQDLYLGIKARYHLAEQWSVHAGMRHYRMESFVNGFSVGASYRF